MIKYGDLLSLVKICRGIPVDTVIRRSGENRDLQFNNDDFCTAIRANLVGAYEAAAVFDGQYELLSHTWQGSMPWADDTFALFYLQSKPPAFYVWADFIQAGQAAEITTQLIYVVQHATSVAILVTGTGDLKKYFNSAWCMCERITIGNVDHSWRVFRNTYDGGVSLNIDAHQDKYLQFLLAEKPALQQFVGTFYGQLEMMNFYRCYNREDWGKIFNVLNGCYLQAQPASGAINLGGFSIQMGSTWNPYADAIAGKVAWGSIVSK